MFSDTFAGIAPGSAPGFIAAQIVGGLLDWRSSPPLPGCRRHRERRRHPSPRRNPPRRSTEFDMTDSPVPLATHHHPDLSIDQEHALKTAATRLHTEFGEHFGVETIERFLHSSYDHLPGAQASPTSCRCWLNDGHASASPPWHEWKARSPTPSPPCYSCAPTTLAVPDGARVLQPPCR